MKLNPLPSLLSGAAVIALTSAAALPAFAEGTGHMVDDATIAAQRSDLAKAADGQGYGPQAPRDISVKTGSNTRAFGQAPDFTEMNLCNIHFHENAEHKGGEFTKYAGNGDGKGYDTGFEYNGELSAKELQPYPHKVGTHDHGSLEPGDTIEAHFVYSSAQVEPGPTLASCVSDAIKNPQLRVDAHVYVLVNDENALDFADIAKVAKVGGYYQAPNVPQTDGTPVAYEGSTTGPKYNTTPSPYQVSWTVHPNVSKVSIQSVDEWLQHNQFDEDHAHGVRNLVVNPELLSPIEDIAG